MFKTATGIVEDLLDFGVDVLGLVREVLWSRGGLILFLLNLALISCAYVAVDGSLWTMFDPEGGSLTALAASLINLPMLIATGLVTSPLLYERHVERFGVLQWAAVSFIFFCVLFQWWVYGYLLERLIRRGRQPSQLSRP
jgi:hypothetical protein